MIFRKAMIVFLIAITFFSFTQCKAVEKKESIKDKQNIIMPQEKGISKLNTDKSMQLVINKEQKEGDPAFYFNYKVFNTKTREVIKKGTFRGMNIDWHDNTSIKLIPYVGMEQKPNSENPEEVLSSDTLTQIQIIKLNH